MGIKLKLSGVVFNQKGSVFLLAIWTVVMLSIYSITIGGLVRQRILVYNRISQRERLRLAAESGAKKVLKEFGVGESNLITKFKKTKDHLFSESDSIQMNDVTVSYKLVDENRKININKADFIYLKNIFQFVAKLSENSAGRLAASVIDYTDPDDSILEYYDKGSERESYAESGFAYGPKNAPFEQISELLFVKGMSPQIYSAVRDYITVYGSGGLNINTADKQALLCTGLHPNLVDKIMEIRKGTTDKAGRMRENYVFGSLSSLLSDLASFYDLSDNERATLFQAVGLNRITVTADCYRMEVNAKISPNNISSTVACIFTVRDGIRYWFQS